VSGLGLLTGGLNAARAFASLSRAEQAALPAALADPAAQEARKILWDRIAEGRPPEELRRYMRAVIRATEPEVVDQGLLLDDLQQAINDVRALADKVKAFEDGLPKWVEAAQVAQRARDAAAADARAKVRALDDLDEKRKARAKELLAQLEARRPKITVVPTEDRPSLGGPGKPYQKPDPNWDPRGEGELWAQYQRALDKGFRMRPDGTFEPATPEALQRDEDLRAFARRVEEIAGMSAGDRLWYVVSGVKWQELAGALGEEGMAAIQGMFSKEGIALMAVTLGLGAFPATQPLAAAIGYYFLGSAVWDVGGEVVAFASGALGARVEDDFVESRKHLVAGVSKGATQAAMFWAGKKVTKVVERRLLDIKAGKVGRTYKTLVAIEEQLQELHDQHNAGNAAAADRAAARVAKLIEDLPEDAAQKVRDLLGISPPAKTGETASTATGKSIHKRLADARRATGEFDLVQSPITDQAGKPILVSKRVDLKTGKPKPESPLQEAVPDAVDFRRGLVLDDKPLGRNLARDRQEIIRFIRAYELREGHLPEVIAITRYNPKTGKPVHTEVYAPSDFLP
jgi:hypothetical protein